MGDRQRRVLNCTFPSRCRDQEIGAWHSGEERRNAITQVNGMYLQRSVLYIYKITGTKGGAIFSSHELENKTLPHEGLCQNVLTELRFLHFTATS